MHYVLRGAVVNFHSIPALKFEKEGGGGGGGGGRTQFKKNKIIPYTGKLCALQIVRYGSSLVVFP